MADQVTHRAAGTALALAALVAAGVTFASAGAATAGTNGCPSLRNVAAFEGRVTVTVGDAATGESPPSGTQTIQLAAAMQNVHIRLGDKRHARTYYDFKGTASGGKVMVDNVFDDTGADAAGELTYSAAADGRSESGILGIDRASCEYKFMAVASVIPAYKGDAEVEPVHLVGFGADNSAQPVPQNLRLHGSETLEAHPTCGNPFARVGGCASIGSGWIVELITLLECGSSDPNYGAAQPSGQCPNDENPKFSTPASFSWDLRPVFEKGSKK